MKNNIKQIVLEIFKREQEIPNLLLDNKLDAAYENIKWIELANKIINKKKNRQRFTLAILLAFVVLMIVGLSFTKTIPTAEIQADITCSGLSLHLNKDWDLSNELQADNIRITEIKNLYTQFKSNTDKKAENLEVIGKNIQLEKLRFSKNSEVSLFIRQDNLIISVNSGFISGNLIIPSGKLIYGERKIVQDEQANPTEIYSFISDTISRYSIPLVLELKTNVLWMFENANFDTIKFIEESPPNSGEYISTINSSNIFIKETQKDFHTSEGESLLLINRTIKKFRLAQKTNLGSLLLSSKVSEIKLVGANQNELSDVTLIDIKPTYFESYYNNEPLAVFWSVILFISGLLWSIRSTLFSK